MNNTIVANLAQSYTIPNVSGLTLHSVNKLQSNSTNTGSLEIPLSGGDLYMPALLAVSYSGPENAAAETAPLQETSIKSQDEFLSTVLARVRDSSEKGEKPVVVFDIDSTLVENQSRTKAILDDFLQEEMLPRDFVQVASALKPETMGYNVVNTFKEHGYTDPVIIKKFMAYWKPRFLSDSYLKYDRPMQGAAKFAQEIHDAGGIVYYLTGRDVPNMKIGTELTLKSGGFPINQKNVYLKLKPDARDDDLEFKKGAVGEIAALGTVVAAFDNEPGNVNFFKKYFPEADVAFVDTVYSDNAPSLQKEIATIDDFSRLS